MGDGPGVAVQGADGGWPAGRHAMNSDSWRRVRDLFEEAIDSHPQDVRQWLEERAPGDPALQAEVQSLLSNYESAGSFLAEPPYVSVPDLLKEAEPLKAGTTVGAYTIIREAGRGGMGRVYLATDARLNRQVA